MIDMSGTTKRWGAWAVCLLTVVGCGGPAGAPPKASAEQKTTAEPRGAVQLEDIEPRKLDVKHLPNAIQVHSKVISGGQPEGEAAFIELARLGVKTVISVDGAQPAVELAKKHGLRYVHLPHGYDGIPEERAKALAKAIRDLPGPIYLHCHHGKHRSPAATATACVAAGMTPSSGALAILKLAGTNPNYRGLYASVEGARAVDPAELDKLAVEFREAVKLPPMAQGMVELEHVHDRLKAIAAWGWKSPPAYPDIDPAHEALLLREHYTEMLRTEAVARETARFRELMQQGETQGQTLEDALRAWQKAGRPQPLPAEIGRTWDQINQGCAACHKEFRDVPLSEKQHGAKK